MRIWRELRDLLSFLSSLWGIFVVLTLLLPLANRWWPVVPLAGGQERSGTSLALLTCFYALLYSFAERHRLVARLRSARANPPGWEPESWSLRSAFDRFGWSLVCFVLYMVFHVTSLQLAGQTGDVTRVVASILSPLALVTYAALFGLLTASFGELAIIEYVKARGRDPLPAGE